MHENIEVATTALLFIRKSATYYKNRLEYQDLVESCLHSLIVNLEYPLRTKALKTLTYTLWIRADQRTIKENMEIIWNLFLDEETRIFKTKEIPTKDVISCAIKCWSVLFTLLDDWEEIPTQK